MSTAPSAPLSAELQRALLDVPRFVANVRPGDHVVALVGGQPRQIEVQRVYVRFTQATLEAAGQEPRPLEWADYEQAVCDAAGRRVDPQSRVVVPGQPLHLLEGGQPRAWTVGEVRDAQLMWVIASGELPAPRTVKADAFIEPLRQTNVLIHSMLAGQASATQLAEPVAIDGVALAEVEQKLDAGPGPEVSALDALVAVLNAPPPAPRPAAARATPQASAVGPGYQTVRDEPEPPPDAGMWRWLAIAALVGGLALAAALLVLQLAPASGLTYLLLGLGLLAFLLAMVASLGLSRPAAAVAVLSAVLVATHLVLWRPAAPPPAGSATPASAPAAR